VKFNKDTVVLIAICIAILLGWQVLSNYMGWNKPAAKPVPASAAQTAPAVPLQIQNAASAAATPENSASGQQAVAVATGDVKPVVCGAMPVSTGPGPEMKPEVLEISGAEKVVFSRPGLAMIDNITLLAFDNASRTGKVVLDSNMSGSLTPPLHCGALSVNGKAAWVSASVLDHSSLPDNGYRVVRRMTDASGQAFKLTQTWQLKPGYVIDYRIEFSVAADAAAVNLGDVYVSGGDLQSLNALTQDIEQGSEFKINYVTEAGAFSMVAVDDDDFPNSPAGRMKWVGISNKYFAVALKGDQTFRPFVVRKEYEKKHYLAAVGAVLENVTVPSGGSAAWNFSYFAGPKTESLLGGFDATAANMLHLSWGPLNYLARFMLWVLVWLHGICGSYGWSIIILTIIVRGLLFPITRKANLSMKKMAAVQPKIKELREKYKDRPELMNQKTMELYRSEKINPLGGCLPLLLQFPVFIALYNALNGAVQLRQVPFWWSADLAGPDTVAHLFGLPVNPLVLAMTALMVLQQHMTPSAMDPMQKKMMYLMPVVMLFFFYSLPSGLTLYWTVSQICSILQMYLQRKWDHKDEAPKTAGAKS